MYASGYFRQDKSGSSVKLPFKWMPLESLQEGLFSEKSDVVSCMYELLSLARLVEPTSPFCSMDRTASAAATVPFVQYWHEGHYHKQLRSHAK